MGIVFHIGCHKTASTWLQQKYFVQHSKIHPIVNSQQPWDDEIVKYIIKTPKEKFDPYHVNGIIESRLAEIGAREDDVAMISAERLSGHPASGGIDRFDIAEKIYSISPAAKIICFVRNQVDVIESVYKTLVSEGFSGKVDDLLLSRWWKIPGFDPVFWEYDLLVSRYYHLFGIENVMVIRYEDFRLDKDSVLADMCGFMGVPFERPLEGDKVTNRNLPSQSLGIVRQMNRMHKTEYNPQPIFTIPSLFRKAVLKLTKKAKSPGSLLDDNMRNAIDLMYEDSNNKLSALIGGCEGKGGSG